MPDASIPRLTPVEARVLGVLAEKQRTVPDTYPLTLNALVAGCNQKTSRDPVMEVSDAQAQQALDTLRSMTLAIESSGGRALRYAHNMERVLQVPPQSTALLAVLMLRGPQTAGELRINCDRLHKFADISAVEGFLHEVAGRATGALVVELTRQPGARENRWAHLLCGAPALEPETLPPPSRSDEAGELAALKVRVQALEAAVAELQALVAAARAGGDR
ncbi:MAG TPA: YceH family protein [Burkholderiales bacterium]|nr:YceH family protein [Burkholderiales bacterium]